MSEKNRITENFSNALGVLLVGKGLQVRSLRSEVCEQGRCPCHAELNDGLWRPSGFVEFPVQGPVLPERHLLLLSGRVDERCDLRVYRQQHPQPHQKHCRGRRLPFFGRLPAGMSVLQPFAGHFHRIDQRVCDSNPGCFWPSPERIPLFSLHFLVLKCSRLPFCAGLATV